MPALLAMVPMMRPCLILAALVLTLALAGSAQAKHEIVCFGHGSTPNSAQCRPIVARYDWLIARRAWFVRYYIRNGCANSKLTNPQWFQDQHCERAFWWIVDHNEAAEQLRYEYSARA